MSIIQELAAFDAQLASRPKFTTILKIGITPEGQYCVGRNESTLDGWLDRKQILDALQQITYAPVTAEDPFALRVTGRQRLVFNLAPDAWFYQQTLAPIVLQTPDPLCNFLDIVMLKDDPYNLGRSKTLYLTDENKKKELVPYQYDLLMDVWQAPGDINSARMPTVIDPDVGNEGGP